MEEYRRVIRLTDPLPCGSWVAEGECGKQAYVAYAYRMRRENTHEGKLIPYSWGLLPVCEQCTRDTMKLYGDDRQ